MSSVNKKEIEKFSKIASEWWDPKGKFKPLHKFNPIRIKYIKENIIQNFKLKNNNIPTYINSEVEGCDGKNTVEEVSIRSNGEIIKIKTSMLCVSGGINPDVNLFTQSKGLIKWDEKYLTFKPHNSFQNTITLGSAGGNFNYQKINEEIENRLDFLKGIIV